MLHHALASVATFDTSPRSGERSYGKRSYAAKCLESRRWSHPEILAGSVGTGRGCITVGDFAYFCEIDGMAQWLRKVLQQVGANRVFHFCATSSFGRARRLSSLVYLRVRCWGKTRCGRMAFVFDALVINGPELWRKFNRR